MIVVNCSQCKAQLEMDEAFAGGVCRCHYCGTIQTVPAAAKRNQAAAPVAAPAPARSARDNGAAAAKGGGGLDALARAVASGGQSRAGMRVAPPPAAASAPQAVDYARPAQQKTMMVPLVIALGVIVLLLSIMLFALLGRTTMVVTNPVTPPNRGAVTSGATARPVPSDGGTDGRGTGRGTDDGSAAVAPIAEPEPVEAAVPRSPHFCGIDLSGVPSVVYVLDRGNASAELFDTLKEATYHSLESLKATQKFQIIFWDNADHPAAYPADGPANVSAQEIEAARAEFADLIAGGRSTPDGAIRRAVQSRPGAIILVTAKAFELEEDLVKTVQSAVTGTTTKVHTVALKTDDDNPILKHIAEITHGEFRIVTGSQLRKYSY